MSLKRYQRYPPIVSTPPSTTKPLTASRPKSPSPSKSLLVQKSVAAQEAATDVLKIGRVPTARNAKGADGMPPHAEENLMASEKFEMIGASSPACGKKRHDCAGQMDEKGIKHN